MNRQEHHWVFGRHCEEELAEEAPSFLQKEGVHILRNGGPIKKGTRQVVHVGIYTAIFPHGHIPPQVR
jgi:hypothetical protein